MNPFIIFDYAGPEYFCQRETELKQISIALENHRNIAIHAIAGMGKTSLIKHALQEMINARTYWPVYVDITLALDFDDLINALGTAILARADHMPADARIITESFIIRAKPLISYDPMSGKASYAFYLDRPGEAEWTLRELLAILEVISRDVDVVVAIDEFPSIMEYPERKLADALPGMISSLENVKYIFSGSKQQLFNSIFSNTSLAFYKNTELMALLEIPASPYRKFISQWIKELNLSFTPDVIPAIFNWTKRHTCFTQFVCHKIADNRERFLDREGLEKVFHQILQEKEPHYLAYRKMLTSHQWKLLVALAIEDGTGRVTTGAFLNIYNLNSSSAVLRGIEALLGKDLIYRSKGAYFVHDVFFAHWLRWKQG